MEIEVITNTIGIEEFLSIGIIGVALSLVGQWLKKKYGIDGLQAKAFALVASIVVGGAIWFLSSTPIWATILGVLTFASTTYALFFSDKRKNEVTS